MTLPLPILDDSTRRTLACDDPAMPHCDTCRSLSPAAHAWRANLAEFCDLPGNLIDFPREACPRELAWLDDGVPSGAIAPPRPSPQPRPSTGDPFTPEVAHARAVEAQAVALPSAWERITHGGFALAKIALGVDRSTDALIAERKAICEACPNWEAGRCSLCGCSTNAKVKLASEACPDAPPRW